MGYEQRSCNQHDNIIGFVLCVCVCVVSARLSQQELSQSGLFCPPVLVLAGELEHLLSIHSTKALDFMTSSYTQQDSGIFFAT